MHLWAWPSSDVVYNGVDLTASARLPHGIVLSGGPSIGRTASNYCFTIDSPQGTGVPPANGAATAAGLLYRDVKPPFQPNVTLLDVYPLPWGDVQMAATWQSLPGPQIGGPGRIQAGALARDQPESAVERDAYANALAYNASRRAHAFSACGSL